MFKLSLLIIVLFVLSCSVESPYCTKKDTMKLMQAGFSKNEISNICYSKKEVRNTVNMTATSTKETGLAKVENKPAKKEINSALIEDENRPTTSEMKIALAQKLPNHVKLEKFVVQASQNYGTEVEPKYVSRFKATAVVLVPLYKKDKFVKYEKEINAEVKDIYYQFIQLVTQKGMKIDVFGKITSSFYQGGWKHNINIDGHPFSEYKGLGMPHENYMSERNPLIIVGSDEERELYVEVNRLRADLKRDLENASEILVGTWRDENSIIDYKSDGTYHTKWDDGKEKSGTWNTSQFTTYSKYTTYLIQKDGQNHSRSVGERMIYIDKNHYTIRGKNKTWHYKRDSELLGNFDAKKIKNQFSVTEAAQKYITQDSIPMSQGVTILFEGLTLQKFNADTVYWAHFSLKNDSNTIFRSKRMLAVNLVSRKSLYGGEKGYGSSGFHKQLMETGVSNVKSFHPGKTLYISYNMGPLKAKKAKALLILSTSSSASSFDQAGKQGKLVLTVPFSIEEKYLLK